MEREPIPIITLPGAIFGVMLIGAIWTFTDSRFLFSIERLQYNFYLSLGAIVIIIGLFLSQLFISIWRKLFGFCSIDYSKEFLNSVPFSKRWIVQNVFDKFWHGGKRDDDNDGKWKPNVPEGILEYSRRRSGAAMTFFLAIITIIILMTAYLAFVFFFANKLGLNCPDLTRFSVYIGSIILVLIIFYFCGVRPNAKDLYEIQKAYIKKGDKEEIKREIQEKLHDC